MNELENETEFLKPGLPVPSEFIRLPTAATGRAAGHRAGSSVCRLPSEERAREHGEWRGGTQHIQLAAGRKNAGTFAKTECGRRVG